MKNKTEYILYATKINEIKFFWKTKQIKSYILEANIEEIERVLSLLWKQENALSELTLAFHENCFLNHVFWKN